MATRLAMVIAVHKMTTTRNFINRHSCEIKTNNYKASVIQLEICDNKHEKWEKNSMIKSCITSLNHANKSRILEDLDQRVEGTYDKLKRGTKRLQRFIQANEGFRDFKFLSDITRFQIQLLHHSAHYNFVHIVVYGGNDIKDNG